MLKASAALGEGASASLSRSWVVSKSHSAAYSGGAVKVAGNGSVMACLLGGDVAFLDVESGQVTRTLRGKGSAQQVAGASATDGDEGGWEGDEEEEEEVVCLALHPSGGEMVTASRNLLLRRWSSSPSQFKCIRTIKAHDQVVKAMEYDRTGSLLATASADRTVKVWNVRKGFCTHNFVGHSAMATSVAFHPSSKRLLLVSASEDCTVRVWSLSSSECLAVLRDHMSVPTGIAFMPDGHTMITAGRDQVLNIWDVRTLRMRRTVPVYEALEGIVALPESFHSQQKSVSKSAQLFAVAGQKGVVRIFQLTEVEGDEKSVSCKCIQERPCPDSQSAFTSLLWRPLGDEGETRGELVAITEDHNFVFLDEKLDVRKLIVGFNDEIIDIKSIPGSSNIAVATNSPELRIFDVGTFAVKLLNGHTDVVLAVDVSPDGKMLATSSKDGTCLLWEVDSGHAVLRCKGHTAAVGAISLSKRPGPYRSSGAFVVSASADKTLQKWRIESSCLNNETIKPGERDRIARAHEKDINHVTISPNDALVASASQDRTVKLWNCQDLSLNGVLTGHKRGVWRVEFSPVDRCIATASGDRSIRIWSLKDFSCLKTLQGHMASVLNIAFVSGGTQLVSSGGDGLLKLWTLRTAECEGTFDGHGSKVWALAPARIGVEDGEMGVNAGLKLISGGADSVINIWRDVTAEEEEVNIKEREKALLLEQDLQNCLYSKEFDKALAIAFELKRPNRVWHIINELLTSDFSGDQSESELVTVPDLAKKVLDPAVRRWSSERISACLGYCREWNTNGRKSAVAQAVFGSILRTAGFPRLKQIKGIHGLANSIYPYSERHFRRVDRLLQSTYIADFTLANMRLLDAEDTGEDVGAVSTMLTKSSLPKAMEIDGVLVYNVVPAELEESSDGNSSEEDGNSSEEDGNSSEEDGNSSEEDGNEGPEDAMPLGVDATDKDDAVSAEGLKQVELSSLPEVAVAEKETDSGGKKVKRGRRSSVHQMPHASAQQDEGGVPPDVTDSFVDEESTLAERSTSNKKSKKKRRASAENQDLAPSAELDAPIKETKARSSSFSRDGQELQASLASSEVSKTPKRARRSGTEDVQATPAPKGRDESTAKKKNRRRKSKESPGGSAAPATPERDIHSATEAPAELVVAKTTASKPRGRSRAVDGGAQTERRLSPPRKAKTDALAGLLSPVRRSLRNKQN